MAKSNDIEITEPKSRKEKIWFSFIKQKAKEKEFGSIKFEATIKNGEVVNLKNIELIENLNLPE